DSLPAEVHGQQPGSAYNGHYGCRCFHPLILSWEFGDYLGGRLREGNVYTSTDALAFLLPYLRWAAGYARRVWLRADAGFPAEPFLAGLEAEPEVRYVMRLKSNAVLERLAAPHVDRILKKEVPEDRAHTIKLSYAAQSWSRERRVVLVIEERPDELMPHWFFLLTHATPEEAPGAALLAHYRKRGATEKDYGDWTNALDLALSSTNRPKSTYGGQVPQRRSSPVDSFAANEAILLMHLVAANLMHAGRCLSERARRPLWSRETFRRLVLKTSAHLARSSRYVTFWIDHHRTRYWEQIAQEMRRLPPIRGSPTLPALPTPA
ncbi:MAG TPA: transposase, partial [Longimicrobiales bacterium]|nr:transposase [Longimicrobiales bacterium]